MDATARHRRRRPDRPSVRGRLVAVGMAAWLLGQLGCGEDKTLAPRQPLSHQGVPVVRVLLTAKPAVSATIAAGDDYHLLADGRTISQSKGALPSLKITRKGDRWRVGRQTVPARQLALKVSGDSFVRFGRTRYRGELHLLPVDEDRIQVVNHVDTESYLAGVLPKELYGGWSLATYRAQAVAARSFALFHRARFGPRRPYDLGAGEASQVYGGMDAETDTSWSAVRQTHGQVLTYGAPGQEKVFLVQYSSSCGGVVNGAGVIRPANDIEPLRGGQTCSDCRPSPRYRWPTTRISKTHIYEALQAVYPSARDLGGVATVRIKSRTPYGRIMWIDVIGPNRKKLTIRGEDLRLALLRTGVKTLYSMNCRLRDLGKQIEFSDGRGNGHGVGMCQWGAEGKAQRGWTSQEILGFYYPGANITPHY
ncbi:hypothetical protein LCGC14_0269500 [marine sediment metagenome]|uniref:Sporulation stage II protein D amidase enhancer LytB N-terminal domain-containing protein n=1 Tax=marine sediment metagenome TaxID=412755 RepID=A0A0F9WK77_9ZZZZ|nr:SpoIID/LytB domain-containing protein [Phycisphaerae bacterium]HDZ43582.1 SpoIID/LytB domain-containing protein [Phycisphaerae bacterium]